MGQITTGIGLISGLDIAGIVDQLIAIEARPRQLVEQQNAVLTSQQVAFTSINASLLGLKNASSTLTNDAIFSATTAFSSNESVLTATSSKGAVPGSYQFLVKQLVAAQRTVTQGFADTNATFIGASTLTFERGEARLDSQTSASQLNGGDGLSRGLIRVTDRSGTTALIDLSEAVTVNDVLNAFNNNINVNVIASVTGDRLTLSDNTGQVLSDLTVANVGSTATADSLGLTGNSAGTDTLAGTQINTLGQNTLLATLNDSNGVRRTSASDDLTFTDGAATTFGVDLSSAQTVGDVLDIINAGANTAGANIIASVAADGVSLLLTDTGGGGASFGVVAANGSKAIEDLGLTPAASGATLDGDRLIASLNSKLIKNLNGGAGLDITLNANGLETATRLSDLFNGAGLNTSGDATEEFFMRGADNIRHDINLDGLTTVQDLIDEVNTVSGGSFTVTLEGNSLRFTDNTVGGGNTRIVAVSGTAAVDMGIAPYNSGVNSVLSADLSPDTPSSTDRTIRIQDRSGAIVDLDLAGAESVYDILETINNEVGLGVTASLNLAGNGLRITDTTAGIGDLIISDIAGATAANLQIAGTYTQDVAEGNDLDLRYITEASTLNQLGIARGKFLIIDSSGASATVDLTQGNEVTLNDVISEINSRGLQINARINDTGDGLLIEDLGPGNVKLSIEDDGSTTAADLGLAGEADNFGDDLNGSFEKTVVIAADDTLTSVQKKINDANLGITASIINDGSPANPFRLSFSSDTPGSSGAFVFDDGGVGLNAVNLSEAQDAVVFFGGNTGLNSLLITSRSNTLDTLIPGADITLNTTSDQAVQVTISRDDSAITSGIKTLINSFNQVNTTIDSFDSYNSDTQERGLLLGDSTLSAVKRTLFNAIIRKNTELTGQFSSLSQVGISVGSGATLKFDSDKFSQALAEDRDAVEALFTFKQKDDEGEITAAGIGIRLDELLSRLTDSDTGSIQSRIEGIDSQLALNTKRIETLDLKLEAKRAILTGQFIAMEQALAGLQGQQGALNSLTNLAASSRF